MTEHTLFVRIIKVVAITYEHDGTIEEAYLAAENDGELYELLPRRDAEAIEDDLEVVDPEFSSILGYDDELQRMNKRDEDRHHRQTAYQRVNPT